MLHPWRKYAGSVIQEFQNLYRCSKSSTSLRHGYNLYPLLYSIKVWQAVLLLLNLFWLVSSAKTFLTSGHTDWRRLFDPEPGVIFKSWPVMKCKATLSPDIQEVTNGDGSLAWFSLESPNPLASCVWPCPFLETEEGQHTSDFPSSHPWSGIVPCREGPLVEQMTMRFPGWRERGQGMRGGCPPNLNGAALVAGNTTVKELTKGYCFSWLRIMFQNIILFNRPTLKELNNHLPTTAICCEILFTVAM